MSDSSDDHDGEEKETALSEQDTLKDTEAIEEEEEEKQEKRKKKRKKKKKKKKRFNKKGENPNPVWQKKIGRTSPNTNVYEIIDVDEKECGSSNEWCTPQSSAHCGACVFCISVIALILMISVFAINMSSWISEWGAASCVGIPKINDKVTAVTGWEYLSGAIIVASIVGTCCSCYIFMKDRPYAIDKDARPKKDIEDWDAGNTRIFCRFQIFLWIFLFVLLFVWFWIMIGIMSGLNDIASTANCHPDTVQEAAKDKTVAFGMLIAVSLIGAVCCGLPLALALVNGRADDDRSGI